MNVEYVNPFIEASISVIKMLCNIDTKRGKIYLKSTNDWVNQIIIIIGVVGKVKGQICFEMSIETAKKIASTMMGGIAIVELDEMSKSAISEMGNMIMGNASAIFANKEISINITPPSLLTGEKIEMRNKITTIVVPLELENLGAIKMNINIEEVA